MDFTRLFKRIFPILAGGFHFCVLASGFVTFGTIDTLMKCGLFYEGFNPSY